MTATVVSALKAGLPGHAANIFAGQTPAQRDQQKIDELERLIGQLTVELAAAKKLSALLS